MGAPRKHTEEQRAQIRARILAGESQSDIARAFGCRQQSISRIVFGRKDHGPTDAAGKLRQKNAVIRWREKNPEKSRMQTRLSQHSLRKQGVVSLQEWKDILQLFNERCAYCGVSDVMTIDHMIPFSKGGTNTADNVVPACGSCNHVKGTHGPLAMVNRNFQLRIA